MFAVSNNSPPALLPLTTARLYHLLQIIIAPRSLSFFPRIVARLLVHPRLLDRSTIHRNSSRRHFPTHFVVRVRDTRL